MTRRVFFSFHYEKDNWRVQQIRNIRDYYGEPLLTANRWEEIQRKGKAAVKKWIDESLNSRSCTVVLIGEETANREWVRYEIEESWRRGKGLVGIYIHNIKDRHGKYSRKGKNPFKGIVIDGVHLDKVVPIYDPPHTRDKEAYRNIMNNIERLVEEGIVVRKSFEPQYEPSYRYNNTRYKSDNRYYDKESQEDGDGWGVIGSALAVGGFLWLCSKLFKQK